MTSARQDIITGAITMAAIVMFVFTGSTVVPAAVKALSGIGGGADRMLVTALLLNLALIVFGWRRCHDLENEIAERKVAEENARLLASRDVLTGFLNRRSMTEMADKILGAPGRQPAALLLIDLDHFKNVNDLYGHATGDGLLRAVAAIVEDSMPATSYCGRLGGDEFAILLLGSAAERETAAEIAETLVARLSQPIEVEGVLAHIGASIGIASADGEGGFEALMRRADIAMYEAKKGGRERYAWFDTSMESELRRRNVIEAGIRAGIPRGEFIPYYEQQIDLLTGHLRGFEVLARWNHPEEGIIEPTDFISVAEATGLISDLSMSVIRQALLEAKGWDEKVSIAVNISPVQLKDPLLAQRILHLLTETGFPAQRLEIEITESSLFENLELAKTTVESFKNQGIRIALDDFGTGYSSLAHLQALPFDRIKIDRSFVASMRASPESSAIVSAIAKLGATLGLPVTAEGIEDNASRKILHRLGCSDAQGWLYGRPMPVEEARKLLATAQFAPAQGGRRPRGLVEDVAEVAQPQALAAAVEDLVESKRHRIRASRSRRRYAG
ncbi:MAG TPA: EAL domain-containing protein [Allosphingosinicella sp.]|jgi:diguanylate cyclase (GGDEF)-like protein